MIASEKRSPLAQLVLFMICLSLVGTFVAGAHYYVIDIPEQKAIAGHPPANPNTDILEKYNACVSTFCYDAVGEEYFKCLYLCKDQWL
ncbi:MAG: hypothetical protein GYA23_01630 [Methanomicrobiales archaeon]|nr:hypothetical protein [Methanomicrobiales archaeon]